MLLNIAFAGASELVREVGMDWMSQDLAARLSARAAQGIGAGLLTARLGRTDGDHQGRFRRRAADLTTSLRIQYRLNNVRIERDHFLVILGFVDRRIPALKRRVRVIYPTWPLSPGATCA